MIRILLFFCLFFLTSAVIANAQVEPFIIQDVKVIGAEELDEKSIISTSGLYSGLKITELNGQISEAIKRLWKLDLFENVDIYRDRENENSVIVSVELSPRLRNVKWENLSKKELGQVSEKLKMVKGRRLTPAIRKSIKNTIQNYFIEKGYQNAFVSLEIEKNEQLADLLISVEKGIKLKIKDISVLGNNTYPIKKLRKPLKPFQKSLGIFKQVYKEETREQVHNNLTEFYTKKGYADFEIVSEKIETDEKGKVFVKLNLSEGKKYYVSSVEWDGNSKYTDDQLARLTGLKRGIIYSNHKIEESLKFKQDGTDVSSLYMDDGYLLFNIRHEIVAVADDQIDILVTMKEGKPAIINDVRLEGNNITNQHVILRQLTTMPGDQFNRKELFRSQSSIASLGFINPNTINVRPIPNPHNSTVDLVYYVEEQPNDKYEFTGTYNGAIGFTGGVGLELNNFSSKNLFKFKNWKTFPRGDGERLALRYNTSGKAYNNFTFNYSNPWMNTERQTSFFINSNYTRIIRTQTDEDGVTSDGTLGITGGSIGTTKRLNWPDPFFSWTKSVSYHNYKFNNYDNSLTVDEGQSNLLTFNNTIARNTINHPFFPTVGSQFSTSLSLTPPYSLFQDEADGDNPYKFAEFMKMMIDYSKYKRIAGKLTLKIGAHFGIIDNYSSDIPLGPFERFHLGGTGLNGQDIFRGNDLIGLRGYRAETLVPVDEVTGLDGGTVYEKLNVELRHPIVLSSSYSAYLYGFLEAGNTWSTKNDFKPLDLYKSAGFGMRFSLPFVGQFGVDWAYGFDKLPGQAKPSGSQFHFTIGMPIR